MCHVVMCGLYRASFHCADVPRVYCTGHRFTALTCHVCREEGVWGTVWKCIHCSEYYLCSACYLAGHHSMAHRFDCLLTREGKG